MDTFLTSFGGTILVAFLLLFANQQSFADGPTIVPQPHQILVGDEVGWKIPKTIKVSTPDNQPLWSAHLEVLGNALALSRGCALKVAGTGEKPDLICQLENGLADEEYRLLVRNQQIHISASHLKGLAHGTATLLQLLSDSGDRELPVMEIRDAPDCRYRNLMLDLGRHPHSVECLQETIDLLWYYKLDSLQLHLTDDQRFAFPSKAFPKLVTESGKISWEQFATLERYAAVRGVTLIPELEVPGHSALLTKIYPDVFGKNSTDVAKLATSRAAIKVLIDEMIELFPSSPYIHIGGDEAYGVPEDLQRDLINDLHAHLKSKGKQTLVWEGPRLGTGENKVNTDVLQINWNTTNFAANEVLDAGYTVINAAWDPLYVVDHYPRNNFTMATPEYIYRGLDLFRFKHVDPGFKTFLNPIVVEPTDRVIGFCMPWWEGREENFFPMITPRLIPMAEIAWNTKHEKDYADFQGRTIKSESVRQRCFYPATISAANLVIADDGVFHGTTSVSLSSAKNGQIHFTLDGSPPTSISNVYNAEIPLTKTAVVRAAIFDNGEQIGHGTRRTFVHVDPIENLALGKLVTTNATSGPPFSIARLTDGGIGKLDYFLGYPTEPNPIEIIIDLGEVTAFNEIVTHAFFNGNTFESYEIFASIDGRKFEPIVNRRDKPATLSAIATHDFPEQRARFLRVVTHGCKGYVFDSFSKLTEIQVFKRQNE